MKLLDKVGLSFDDISLVPQYSTVDSRKEVSTSIKLGKHTLMVPLISSNMDTITGPEMAIRMAQLGGLGILHRFEDISVQELWVKRVKADARNNIVAMLSYVFPVAASTGVGWKSEEDVRTLVNAGADIICIDVAHGDMKKCHDVAYILAKLFPDTLFISGSIATAGAAQRAIDSGCKVLRVGVGSGSACTTRIMGATGVPQVTALIDICQLAKQHDIPVIADGGCKYIGDVAKAIGLGATAVMSGSLFSGTKETPGRIHRSGMFPNEKIYKEYRGSASYESKVARGEVGNNVEGVSQLVTYRGEVAPIVDKAMDGLRSAMSYSGAKDIAEFHEKATFIQVSQASQLEALPHGLSWNK